MRPLYTRRILAGAFIQSARRVTVRKNYFWPSESTSYVRTSARVASQMVTTAVPRLQNTRNFVQELRNFRNPGSKTDGLFVA
jgi:hypothetical protein